MSFFLFVIFVLSCLVGYMVVWRVTPSLHAPLMALTNGISSVIVVGAIFFCAFLSPMQGTSFWCALGALFLCIVNIVGGFWISLRMLSMFR